MIVATDDVRDAHVEVVYDDPEVVGRNAVCTQQHEVIQLRIRHGDCTFDEVVEDDIPLVGISETHHRRAVRGRDEPGSLRALGPPAPVIARLLAARALALAHRVQIFLARPAAVRLSLRDELLGDFLVPSEALHLEERTLIPVEPEPAHGVEDRLHRGFGRALEVRVLDAQDEFTAVLSGVRPREESGPRPADMEVAGRARSKTGSDHRHAWNRRIVRDGIAGAPGPTLEKICYTSQPRAVSSAVEHSPHTGGATGSIPVPPTINQWLTVLSGLEYEISMKMTGRLS